MLLSTGLMLCLWPISWLSGLFLCLYIVSFITLVYSAQERSFSYQVSEDGCIELFKPQLIKGVISKRSFFSRWIMILCIEVESVQQAFIIEKHNKKRRWFVVFSDNLPEKQYRFLARLITQAASS